MTSLQALQNKVASLEQSLSLAQFTVSLMEDKRGKDEELAQLKAQLKLAERQQRELMGKLAEANRNVDRQQSLARMKERAAKTVEMSENTGSKNKRGKKTTKSSGDPALDDVGTDEEMGR